MPGGVLIMALTGLREHWDDIWGGIKNTASETWDAITGVVKGGTNSVISAANVMIGGLNKIKFTVPDVWGLPNRGETFGISLQQIPHLARGAVVTEPTLAMIGEAA